MAHFTGRRRSSNGDKLHQEQTKLRSPESGSKKSAKQNGSKSKKQQRASSPDSPSDMEIDGEEDENNDVEDPEESAEEPDAEALPSVRKRLAGLESSDSTAGAEEDDSDDDGYAGLGDISDDEDNGDGERENEGHVLRKAEMDLIKEFERKHKRATDFEEMFAVTAEEGDDSNSAVDLNEDPFAGLEAHDSLYQDLWNDAEYDLADWRLPVDEFNPDTASNKKKVRFEETRSRTSSVSSQDSADDANETFPDLFMSQDDPALAQRFALDTDPDATFTGDYSDAESCYDFDGEDEILAFELDEESDSDDDEMSSEASDDDGDTTDEETEEETIARMLEMQRAAGKKSPRVAPSTPAGTKRPRANSAGSPLTPKTGKGPKTGTFILDPTRAAMSADAASNKIKLQPPTRPTEKDKDFWQRAKTATSRGSSPTTSVGYVLPKRGATEAPQRPFTAQSTLASMFNGNIDLIRNTEDQGVTTDMFPPTPTVSRPATSFGSTTWTEDSEDFEPIEDIDMDDFLDMSSDSETDDDEDERPTTATSADVFQTPRNDNMTSGLLDHLEQQRGLVGSFRRNQSQVKQLSSMASHPAKRAATLESNALQTGRRGAANTPMTPARKNRASQDMSLTGSGVKKSLNSPLVARQRRRSRGQSISGNGIYQTLGPAVSQ